MKDLSYPNFSFFSYYHGLSNRLINLVNIVNPCQPTKSVIVNALWDTGAQCSLISMSVVEKLGLTANGKMKIKTPSGEKEFDTYMVDAIIPAEEEGVRFTGIQVAESMIGSQNVDFLVGMNIICMGDFAVSNYNGRTAFTFRMPSMNETNYRAQMIARKSISDKRKRK